MKKLFLFCFVFMLLFQTASFAQTYRTAAGLQIDFGDGSTLVGPSIKHFFNPNSAVQAEVLFGNNITFIQGFYEYHGAIQNAGGLTWYLGIGPSFGLYDGGSDFYLRPLLGMDLKIANAPIDLAFDWRPAIYLGDNSDFEPARFGLGFRFVFN